MVPSRWNSFFDDDIPDPVARQNGKVGVALFRFRGTTGAGASLEHGLFGDAIEGAVSMVELLDKLRFIERKVLVPSPSNDATAYQTALLLRQCSPGKEVPAVVGHVEHRQAEDSPMVLVSLLLDQHRCGLV